MATLIKKEQYAVNLPNGEVEIHHFETDADLVIMPTGISLAEWVAAITMYKQLILSGDVTGSVTFNPAKEGNMEIETEVTDDSHSHTGSTIKVQKPLRVITSGTNSDLVVSDVTVEELNALSGVKSNIQDQIDALSAKADESGIYLGSTAPEDAKVGSLWMETLT